MPRSILQEKKNQCQVRLISKSSIHHIHTSQMPTRWDGGVVVTQDLPWSGWGQIRASGLILRCGQAATTFDLPGEEDDWAGDGAEEQKGAIEEEALGNPIPHRHVFARAKRSGGSGTRKWNPFPFFWQWIGRSPTFLGLESGEILFPNSRGSRTGRARMCFQFGPIPRIQRGYVTRVREVRILIIFSDHDKLRSLNGVSPAFKERCFRHIHNVRLVGSVHLFCEWG
jgi:hypothetical protein